MGQSHPLVVPAMVVSLYTESEPLVGVSGRVATHPSAERYDVARDSLDSIFI